MKKLAFTATLAMLSALACAEAAAQSGSDSDTKPNNIVSGDAGLPVNTVSSSHRPRIPDTNLIGKSASGGEKVTAAELDVSSPNRERQGLQSYAVLDIATGAKFKVYFDKDSSAVAMEAIPALASMYRDVASSIGVAPNTVEWDDVMFARNSHALIVANKPWDIDVDKNGRLGKTGRRSLFSTIPHEQTHSTQGNLQKMPRWYSEGQATWAENRITEKWAPELAAKEREEHTQALAEAEAKGPLALHAWGGVTVKREAILRQMPPEQRVKYEKDPTLSLPAGNGSWLFRPEDVTSDESNTSARYAASFKIFERIENEAGLDALQAWFKAVREAKTPLTNDLLMSLAKTHTKIDISNDIK